MRNDMKGDFGAVQWTGKKSLHKFSFHPLNLLRPTVSTSKGRSEETELNLFVIGRSIGHDENYKINEQMGLRNGNGFIVCTVKFTNYSFYSKKFCFIEQRKKWRQFFFGPDIMLVLARLGWTSDNIMHL